MLTLWQPSLSDEYTSASPAALAQRISARRAELGSRLVILGHHYQTDEIIRHADFTGDSLKLSQLAAAKVGEVGAKFVVFCGVHFMAETADMLTPDDVAVILPDLSAGCSMADMANYDDTIAAWEAIHASLKASGWHGRIIPITYINSTAAIKAFVGSNGGAVCTSSNAHAVLDWALAGGTQKRKKGEDIKVLFLPDQHLGRNTACKMGYKAATDTCVYDPRLAAKGDELGGATAAQIKRSTIILWAGHCSVHKLFRPEHIASIREAEQALPKNERTRIIVHPECAKEVVDLADDAGSTEYIIKRVRAAKPGEKWAVGTEVHLVSRLAKEAATRADGPVHVRILSDCQCLCTTMYRIDQPHLCWVLDQLAASPAKVVNRITVRPDVRAPALLALDRMLALSAPAAQAADGEPPESAGAGVKAHTRAKAAT